MKTTIILSALALMVAFNGCSKEAKPSVNNLSMDKPLLASGSIVGYAYMDGGTELVSVSEERHTPKNGEEIIRLTDSGFYPDYYLTNKDINGDTIYCVFPSWKNEKKGRKEKCDSEYTTHSFGQVMFNLALFFYVPNFQSFDKEYFLKIVKDNNLIEEKRKLQYSKID